MLNEADLKALVSGVVSGLPPGAQIQMTTFVPKLGDSDAAAQPVFALFVASTKEDLAKSMDLLGYGLAKGVGIDGPVAPASEPLSLRTLN